MEWTKNTFANIIDSRKRLRHSTEQEAAEQDIDRNNAERLSKRIREDMPPYMRGPNRKGAIDKLAIYEKIKEKRLTAMRKTTAYKFLMNVAAFTNESIDTYWQDDTFSDDNKPTAFTITEQMVAETGRVAEQLAKGDVQKWCINGPAFPIAKSIVGPGMEALHLTSNRIAFDQITNFNQFQIWLQQNVINVGWLNNLTVRKTTNKTNLAVRKTENKTILFRDLSSIQLSNKKMNHLILADGTNLTQDDFNAYQMRVESERLARRRDAEIRDDVADDIGDDIGADLLLLENERIADNGPRDIEFINQQINPIKITSNVYQSDLLADYLYTEPNIRETIDHINRIWTTINIPTLVEFEYGDGTVVPLSTGEQKVNQLLACATATTRNLTEMTRVASALYSEDSVNWSDNNLNGLVTAAKALDSTVKRLDFLSTATLFNLYIRRDNNNRDAYRRLTSEIKEASSECTALVVQVQNIAKLFTGLFYTYTVTAADVHGEKLVDTPVGVIPVPIPNPPVPNTQIRVRIPDSATFVNEEVDTYYHRRLHYWKHQLLIEHDDAQVMYNVDKWYQQTPWAIGKIFFSPLIYGHMHEVHHAVTRCHPKFKDHGIKHLAEHHCFLFAKCVALAIRGSTILSGKRYGLDRSFMRINMEKRRAMHAWKHEDEKKAEAQIKEDKRSATSASTNLVVSSGSSGSSGSYRPFSELVRGI